MTEMQKENHLADPWQVLTSLKKYTCRKISTKF